MRRAAGPVLASRVQPSSQVGRAARRAPVRSRSSERSRPERSRTDRTACRQLPAGREQQTVVAVAHALGQTRAVVERAAPARRRRTDRATFIGMSRPDDDRCRHSPRSALPTTRGYSSGSSHRVRSCTRLRRQPGEPALELRPPRAVAGDQNDQIRESGGWRRPPPSRGCDPRAYATASMTTSKSSSSVQLVGQTMKPTAFSRDAEPREQPLTEPLALDPLERHERRRRADRTARWRA